MVKKRFIENKLFYCILFPIDTSKVFLTESSLGYTAGLFLIFFFSGFNLKILIKKILLKK